MHAPKRGIMAGKVVRFVYIAAKRIEWDIALGGTFDETSEGVNNFWGLMTRAKKQSGGDKVVGGGARKEHKNTGVDLVEGGQERDGSVVFRFKMIPARGPQTKFSYSCVLLVSVESARVLLQSWWARLLTGASRQTHHDDHDDNGDEHAHADDDGDHDDDDDDDNEDDDDDDDDGEDGGDDDDNDADDEHDEDDGDGDRDGDGAGYGEGGFDDDGDGDGRGNGGGFRFRCTARQFRTCLILSLIHI